ncbi:MAG: hypothetical protein M4579_004044 [Chaenotheca gracillima]|nr:MAG: hypothetical protein M4579_004044 [Chaenotheca gracillima]
MSRTGSGNQPSVPGTPRIIAATPTPSEGADSQDNYFGPVTRSRQRVSSPPAISEDTDEGSGASSSSESSFELKRARTRSRSPITAAVKGLTGASSTTKTPADSPSSNGKPTSSSSSSNGYLSPAAASSSYWRSFSRSPSPLGLIPIHRHWRSFIHRHEIPRKVLHVSIGFFTTYLYSSGVQTSSITPWLMSALIPIATVDVARHRFPSLNRFYIRVLGALMRESEVDGWNGVIWYLLGAWTVLRWFPKDVGVMGVLLLSWCDTAASAVGRTYGRYTPRIRRGKSLAGWAAAFAVGVATAATFWGWVAPSTGGVADQVEGCRFMFTGRLTLPSSLRGLLRLNDGQSTIEGGLALGMMSLCTGFIGAASEVIDLWGWDDNLTIPVLSGLGMWGFLKVFG